IYQGIFYRIIFCIYQQEAWLLHAFEKETKKTPLRELELTKSRMTQLIGRR
ncbi:MAG: type II toxin-antitoxin system RelE/ParE family toxin, partial [Elusimicrobia bacterium]|nr:type II toxin-antitoxin system RelE/ParE family toxin [Elusimicrobiota bacterium]